ncbi:MAG: SUF system Fe-S cluster assembly regulator [Myxococcota bacterium]
MVRLSRLTDYGIVLMAHLAERERRSDSSSPHNAREVAEETSLPLPVVSKILKSLARQGLLVSQRGAKGGYTLARIPEQISVAEMIHALEGPIGLTECTVHPGQCVQEENCHVREPWQVINYAVRQTLGRIKLADLAGPAAPGSTVPLSSLGVDITDVVES